MPTRKTVTLLPKIGRRAERGHAWIFANEVAEVVGEPAPGDEVAIRSAKGHFLGMALFSSSSLIRARIYSRQIDQPCDAAFLTERLRAALDFRRVAFAGALPPSFRLVHGEGDSLPGLVVDVFGQPGQPPHVSVQLTTAGMDLRRAEIVAALQDLLHPAAIVERSDVNFRNLEGLEPLKQTLAGLPASPCLFEENGVLLYCDLLEGQKTGFYLDQAANRAWLKPRLAGARVLDMFCYVGAWSILAAANGAREITGVDSSAPALTLARRAAAELPAGAPRPEFIEADAFEHLRAAVDAAKQYEIVVLDPPALAKNKRDLTRALEAYRELNLRALQLLAPGGLLVTCSCSHHVADADFREMLILAARDAARGRARNADFIIDHVGGQNADHPVPLATPEAGYLKCLAIRRR